MTLLAGCLSVGILIDLLSSFFGRTGVKMSSPSDQYKVKRGVSAKAFRMADPVGTLFGFPHALSRAELYRWCLSRWPQLIPAPYRIIPWSGTHSVKQEPPFENPLKSFVASGQAFFAPLVWDSYFIPALALVAGVRTLRVTDGERVLGEFGVDHLTPALLALYLAEAAPRGEEDDSLVCYLSGVPIVVIAAMRGEGAHETLRTIRASLESVVVQYSKDSRRESSRFDVSSPSFYRPHPLLYRGVNASEK